MKLFVAFAFLLVSITASPPPLVHDVETNEEVQNRLVVASVVQGMINDIIQQIKDGDMDPWTLENVSEAFALPVPSLLSASGHIIGAQLTGLSNIVTNRLSYGLLNSRLTLDLVFKSLHVGVTSAAFEVESLGGNLSASVRGGITVKDVGVFGTIRVSVGVISGVTISNPDLSVQLGGIDSHLEVSLFGKDRSDQINNFASVTVPGAIKAHENDINTFINLIALEAINSM